jgi:hypothetical protein
MRLCAFTQQFGNTVQLSLQAKCGNLKKEKGALGRKGACPLF